MISDAVIVQLISTVGTIATVLLTGRQLRKKARRDHNETNTKLDKIGRSLSPDISTFDLADVPIDAPKKRHIQKRD